ncbi:MAG: DUF1289 domain-containing protein [Hyphomicrobiales bacterium]|nr:DUF1289 domain-containing protein [Hyphomicrobiales bacterium]
MTTTVPTPCVGICEMDAVSGLCRGCARNSDEIALWQSADNSEKLAIWDAIARRRPQLAMSAYRLPWSADDIAAMIERSLHGRWGRWVLGAPGASVDFEIAPHEEAEIISNASEITAVTARGALRLLKHEKMIALAFGDAGDSSGPEAIGLILPRGRLDLRRADGVTCAGADENSVCSAHQESMLFDLGRAALAASRFCLRTSNSQLADHLTSLAGEREFCSADILTRHTAASAMHAIVETGLGRAEAFAPPADEFVWRADAHMPELPEGWELKPVFAPCALFYPSRRRPAGIFVDGPF